MEQLLNLLWLLVALIVICAWLRHRRRVRRSGYQVRLVWQVLALSIVLIFLFYAISITDDLHWDVIAAEASEGARKVKCLASIVAATPCIDFLALLFAIACLFATHKLDTIRRQLSIGLPAAGFHREFSGLSPPPLF
jgi:hypothetical protein